MIRMCLNPLLLFRIKLFKFVSVGAVLLSLGVTTLADPMNCGLTQTSATCVHESGPFLSTDEFRHVNALYILESNLSNTSPKDLSDFKDLYTLHISNSSDAAANLLSLISSQLRELRIISTPLFPNRHLFSEGDSRLVMLTLVDVGLINISSDVLGHHPKMKVLELGENKIATIEKGTFEGLPDLRKLNLSKNYIENLPSGVFSHMKQLRALDISKNHIGVLQKNLFCSLENLEWLNLSNNKIYALEWRALEGSVTKLQMLDLRGNALGAEFHHLYLPLENDKTNGILCSVCQSDGTTTELIDNACGNSVALAALWQDFAVVYDSNSRLGSRVYLNDNPVCKTHMQTSLSSRPEAPDDAKEHKGLEVLVDTVTFGKVCLPHERFRLFLQEACVEGGRSPIALEVSTVPNPEELVHQPPVNVAQFQIYGVCAIVAVVFVVVAFWKVPKRLRSKTEGVTEGEQEQLAVHEKEEV